MKRVSIGFLVAPLAVPVVMFCVFRLSTDHIPLPGFLISTGIVSYIFTGLIGIPAYILYRKWRLNNASSYLLGGFVLGFIPAVIFSILSGYLIFIFATVAAAVEALLFWLIAVKEPNNTAQSDAKPRLRRGNRAAGL